MLYCYDAALNYLHRLVVKNNTFYDDFSLAEAIFDNLSICSALNLTGQCITVLRLS